MSPVEARLAHADGQRTTGEDDYGGVVWFWTEVVRVISHCTSTYADAMRDDSWLLGGAVLAAAEHDSILGN